MIERGEVNSWLIEHGRLIDPANNIDQVGRLLIVDGRIAAIDPSDGDIPPDVQRCDARNQIVAPGLIEMGADLGEPGREEDETLAAGCMAALAGGFTSVACSANTEPAVDTAAGVQFILQKSSQLNLCKVFPIGCLSKQRRGEQLSEIGALVEAGVIALSDLPDAIENTALLRRALEYCTMFDRPILDHPEIMSLSRGGVMHEGLTQLVLGLSPMPAEAEDLATARDLRLVEATGGRLHLMCVSTQGSVDICRRARARGLPFTVGIYPANFHLSDDLLRNFDSRCKVNPPFRSSEHIEACLAALADGTIDVISSGHRPMASEKKLQELDAAPFGMISLETTLAAVITHLVRPGILSWLDAIRKLTVGPAKVLGLKSGTLSIGANADVVVIDPEIAWNPDPETLFSKASNTPLAGDTMYGQAVLTFVDGVCRFSRSVEVV